MIQKLISNNNYTFEGWDMIIIVINKIIFVANLKHQKQEFASFNLRHNIQIYNSTLRALFKTFIVFWGIFSGLDRFIWDYRYQ